MKAEETNMKNTMNSTTAAKADARRLPTFSTPENLEMSFSTVLSFGEYTLVAGYYYMGDGKNYYSALYRFTTADHTCEGKVKLVTTSDEQFEDNGHAIAWAMSKAN